MLSSSDNLSLLLQVPGLLVISHGGSSNFLIVLLGVGRSLVRWVGVADKTVSNTSFLSSSVTSLNGLVNTSEVLINLFLVRTHVCSELLGDLKVSADVNLLLLLLRGLTSSLRLMLSH